MYHYVRDLQNSKYPNIKGLDVSLFEKQLDFFLDNFNIIKMEDIIDSIKNQTPLPEKALLLTFDDGYIDHFEYVFPLLKQRNLQGSFFIPGSPLKDHTLLDVNKVHFILACTEIEKLVEDLKDKMDYHRSEEFQYPATHKLWNEYAIATRFDNKETIFFKRMLQTVLPEKIRNIIVDELFKKYVGVDEKTMSKELYMSHEQLKIMKDEGMFIGVHGYKHYWLANLTSQQMKQDILDSLQVLKDYIDSNQWVMNYPNGNYNDDVIDFIKSKGAILGLSTITNTADLNNDNIYALPRLDCNDFPPKSDNYLKYLKEEDVQ